MGKVYTNELAIGKLQNHYPKQTIVRLLHHEGPLKWKDIKSGITYTEGKTLEKEYYISDSTCSSGLKYLFTINPNLRYIKKRYLKSIAKLIDSLNWVSEDIEKNPDTEQKVCALIKTLTNKSKIDIK